MFKRIKANDFLSWQELDFEINDGVTLIEGHNYDDNTSEGSGKSAVVNALCWGLYGKLPKDAKIDAVIRDGSSKCSVDIELESGAHVVRSRGPNRVFILSPDGNRMAGKDARETQKMIDELLGMSFDTFVQSVYFAQNYPKKFITSNEEERAKILSEILDLKVFDKARDVTKNIANQLDSEAGIVKEQLRGEAAKVDLLKEKAREYEEIKAQRLAKLEQNLSALYLKTKDLKIAHTKAALEDATDTLNQVQFAIEVATEQRVKVQVDLGSVDTVKERHRIVQLQLSDKKHQRVLLEEALHGDICPQCGTKFPPDTHHKAKTKSDIKGIINEILELERDIEAHVIVGEEELKADLNQLNKEVQTLKLGQLHAKDVFRIANLRAMEAVNLGSQIKAAQQELEQEQNESSLSKMIDETTSQIAEITNALELLGEVLLEKEQEAARATELRQGFREVKSYVFQGILAELTNKVNNYLSELFETTVQAHIQNISEDGSVSKIQIDVTLDGIRRPLGLYSGGQFRRIQLAVDFAISDIIASRSKSPISLKILDESFKDLSESSMEKLLRLLEQQKGGTILIEHNSIFKSIVNNVFSIELKDGISRSI